MAHEDELLLPFGHLSVLSPSPSQEHNPVGTITLDGTIPPSNPSAALLSRLDKLHNKYERLRAGYEAELAKVDKLKDDFYARANMKMPKSDFDAAEAALETLNNYIDERKADLKKLKNELDNFVADFNAERLNAQGLVTQLSRTALRVFVNAWLAEMGYNPDTCGPRKEWMEDNLSHLVPANCSTPTDFLSLLSLLFARECPDASRMKSLDVAFAIQTMGAAAPDFRSIFIDCLGHTVEDEIDGRVFPTFIDARIDAVDRFVKIVYTPIP